MSIRIHTHTSRKLKTEPQWISYRMSIGCRSSDRSLAWVPSGEKKTTNKPEEDESPVRKLQSVTDRGLTLHCLQINNPNGVWTRSNTG